MLRVSFSILQRILLLQWLSSYFDYLVQSFRLSSAPVFPTFCPQFGPVCWPQEHLSNPHHLLRYPVANMLIERSFSSRRFHFCKTELTIKIAYKGSKRIYMSWPALLCSCRSYLGFCLFRDVAEQKITVVHLWCQDQHSGGSGLGKSLSPMNLGKGSQLQPVVEQVPFPSQSIFSLIFTLSNFSLMNPLLLYHQSRRSTKFLLI